VHIMKGHEAIVRCVTFSPEGGYIASGGDDSKADPRTQPRTAHVPPARSAYARAHVASIKHPSPPPPRHVCK
jgi:WD40 repeat protein